MMQHLYDRSHFGSINHWNVGHYVGSNDFVISLAINLEIIFHYEKKKIVFETASVFHDMAKQSFHSPRYLH